MDGVSEMAVKVRCGKNRETIDVALLQVPKYNDGLQPYKCVQVRIVVHPIFLSSLSWYLKSSFFDDEKQGRDLETEWIACSFSALEREANLKGGQCDDVGHMVIKKTWQESSKGRRVPSCCLKSLLPFVDIEATGCYIEKAQPPRHFWHWASNTLVRWYLRSLQPSVQSSCTNSKP